MSNLSDRSILDLIRAGRAQTQAEVCRLTGMRSSTISCVLKRLREAGLVETVGKRVVGPGKPATVFRFAPPGEVLAVHIDGSHAEVGIVTLAGTVLTECSVELGKSPEPHALLQELSGRARQLAEQSDIKWGGLRALGLSVNGYVSPDGVLQFSTVLPWRDVSVVQLAREAFGLTVYCSDGRSRAVAEYRHGAGQGSEVMLFFNAADGVSARPVVRGELFRGARSHSGEIGHIVVTPNGPHCGCGQRGCLEATISGPALVRRIIADTAADSKLAQEPAIARLVHLAENSRASKVVDELVRLATEEQFAYAQRMVDEVVSSAGRALGTAVACFDPDCIVIDGYIFRNRPALLHRLWQSANTHFNPDYSEVVRLTPAMLGASAELISLATFVGDSLAYTPELTG
ncbi:ROK family transcriptional regulator [Adhaeretor mobilis]|uniref:N-acetylglucosamine repressor n=1 Tax=Adhaeretor mobilis TaxID=1930276 RepID=A0A517MZT7_9BACT|nr:ROK family transcriptional regulator [Adhaeretor mobilis]QDT00402.1 N-acetylglucosamine repressor [Adhaeretor mobilis]